VGVLDAPERDGMERALRGVLGELERRAQE
jgi:hypothetical protein